MTIPTSYGLAKGWPVATGQITPTQITISGTPGAATIGVAYSFTPTTANGSGTKTFSYSGTALASFGLSFDTTTGAITGTVSGSAGTITGTIGVTDSTGSASLPISIVVSVATATLNTLTLSGSLQNGVSASGTIIGATTGSTIACNIPGITVNSGARTYSGTPYTTGAIANALVETLAGATNTPNNSSITVAATAVPNAGNLVAAWYAEDLVALGLGNNATVGTVGVSPWVDRINGINAVFALGAPKLKTNVENGLPSVQFPGGAYLTAGQNATLIAALNTRAYTVYVIARNLLTAGTASFICTSGLGGFFFTADGTNIGLNGSTVPFSAAQGTSLFSAGIRGSNTGGGTDGTWTTYGHTVINGCAANGSTTSPKAPTASSDVFIGGQAGATGKFEILELFIYTGENTHAHDIQFEKYRCDKYAKAYPWAAQSYMPIIAGDSISNGTLCDSWTVATPKLIADTLGLGFGQWINASTAAISAASLLLKDAITLAGLPAQVGITTKIHEFEWVNAIGHGQNATTCASTQQSICNMYKSQGFTKVILGTTIDYGNRTNTGANSKTLYCSNLAALPAGTYDYFNPIHTDATIGVDGAAPNTGSNTYFADSIAHPTGHANFPTVQSGAPYLAALISAAFVAA